MASSHLVVDRQHPMRAAEPLPIRSLYTQSAHTCTIPANALHCRQRPGSRLRSRRPAGRGRFSIVYSLTGNALRENSFNLTGSLNCSSSIRMSIRARTGPSRSMSCCTRWIPTACPMPCWPAHNGNYDNSYLLDCVRRYPGRFKAVGPGRCAGPGPVAHARDLPQAGWLGNPHQSQQGARMGSRQFAVQGGRRPGHDRQRDRRCRELRLGAVQEAARQLPGHAFLPGAPGAQPGLGRRAAALHAGTAKRWSARGGRTPPSRSRGSAKS